MNSLASTIASLNTATASARQDASATQGSGALSSLTANPQAKARMAVTTQAALTTAASGHRAALAGQTLSKQQAALAKDLVAALGKAGVKLEGTVEFSVGSDGTVGIQGSDADKAATTALLKSDTSRPNIATRVATLARDALKLSSTIQQSAAISQAARYSGKPGGVMTLYASLMQQTNTTPAVFSVSATTSSLSYAGSLATQA
jgi:hypothetical protein